MRLEQLLELREELTHYILPQRIGRLREVLEKRTNFIHVVVEDLYHERNAAAIFRTCDCFGIQSASVIERKYSNEVAKRIARGSDKWMDITVYDAPNAKNTIACLSQLKEKGYQIVATTPHQPTIELPDFNPKQMVALLFGTEETGLSKEALQLADERLSIPILGFADSFNVSVAAALVLQQATAWVRNNTENWQLEAEEKLRIEVDWLVQSLGEAGTIIQKKHERTTQP